jgi:hypothetical protein
MLIVVELQGVLIEEHRLRLLERDSVLLKICAAFRLVPLERYHAYSVCTRGDLSISGPNAKVSGGWCEEAFAQSWRSHAQKAAEHETSAYSTPNLPLIREQVCHPFQTKAATDSGAKLPPWQMAPEQVLKALDAG